MQPPRKWVPCHSQSGPFLTGCGSHYEPQRWDSACVRSHVEASSWSSGNVSFWIVWLDFPSPRGSDKLDIDNLAMLPNGIHPQAAAHFCFWRQPENLGPGSLSVFNKNSTLRTSKVGGGVLCCMALRAELRLDFWTHVEHEIKIDRADGIHWQFELPPNMLLGEGFAQIDFFKVQVVEKYIWSEWPSFHRDTVTHWGS